MSASLAIGSRETAARCRLLGAAAGGAAFRPPAGHDRANNSGWSFSGCRFNSGLFCAAPGILGMDSSPELDNIALSLPQL